MFGRLIRFHNHKQVMVTLHLVKTGRHAVQRHLIIVPWERDNVLGGSSPLAGGRSHTHSEVTSERVGTRFNRESLSICFLQ